MQKIEWLELLFSIALASFGGIVKKLADQDKNPKEIITAGAYVSAAIISCFVGIVVYILCKNFEWSSFLILGVTAISGFIGTPVIYTLANLSLKKVGNLIDKVVEDDGKKTM